MSDIESAKALMLKAHAGQTRWDGRPYSVHPQKVVDILYQMGIISPDIISAAYLHDVLEDTPVPEYAIKEQFNIIIYGLVKELTFKDSSKDDNIYYNQIRKLSKNAKLIKMADIIANITDAGKKSNHFIEKRIKALGILVGND